MTRKPRRKTITFGGVSTIKIGAPSPLADLYYWVMEMSWPSFVGVVAASYLAINLCFGIVYALLPGTVDHAAPGSLLDGFFFSVDTLGTVGYGVMAPGTHLGHMIASIEILTGLFFSATMTGLIFARFARPRQSLEFSRVAVIGRYAGRRALMVRVVSTRSRPLADATAQMSLLETVHLDKGGTYRGLTPLPLVRDVNPLLGLSWTLVHLMDDDSPVFTMLNGPDRFVLTVTIGGVDTLLASPSQGGMRYDRDHVRIDHEFVDVISDDGDAITVDITKLHNTEPITG